LLQGGRKRGGHVTDLDTYFNRIDRFDGQIGAFWTVTPEVAHAHEDGPLAGIGIGVKDNIDVAGVRCTNGTPYFATRIAETDAEAIRRLRAAGAAIMGKTAQHELAFGGTTQNEHFGNCRNPWDTRRIPGGSSGGSGAAVAADLCAAALGTDTGGSVRVPAALCGVTGLRPTHGTIPNDGVFPTSWSFDTVGPIARSANLLRRLTEAMTGLELPTKPANALRIGLFVPDCDAEIAAAVRVAADMVGEVSPYEPPPLAEAWTVAWRIVAVEALAIHKERLSAQPGLFGEDVRTRLISGEAIGGVQHAADLEWARNWKRQIADVFEGLDMIALPTTLGVAGRADESEMNAATRSVSAVTYPWVLAGLPAIALPCGFSSEGLPISIQLVGPAGGDAKLLDAAEAFQLATDWHLRFPPLETSDSVSAAGPL
jgi:aspartyl-tRNA(Asn)/glutamyl-tRNA(Gln) amidotransferase subunit A